MAVTADKRGPKTNAPRRDARGGRDRKPKAPPPPRSVKLGKPCGLTAKQIRDICRKEIPGYDAFATAGEAKFDVESARRAIDFFHCELTHVKGKQARHPFVLESWEQAILGNLFGWKNPDRTRRYRETLVYVPRKNGKSPLAAGLLLYMLLEDGEYGAEIYGAASKYEQATLVFHHARGMVRNNPKLECRVQIFKGQAKAIQLTDHASNVDDVGVYRVISGEHNEGHGHNMSCGVIDELHLQTGRDLVDSMRTATASEDRTQPLIVYITTADFERDGSVCNEMHDYAGKVRDCIVDDATFLPVIYEATSDDDWTDEAIWEKANPNLDVSVSRDYLRKESKKAQEMPAYENAFKRLHLNVRTQQDTRWLGMDDWDACGTSVDPAELAGKVCFGGLDLATTTDLTAFVLVFPDEDGGFDVLPHFWVPRDNAAERVKRDRVDYLSWERQGFLTFTDGNVTDYSFVRADINRMGDEYGIQQIGFDPWNATQLATQLADEDGLDMVKFRQGFISMSEPSKLLERLIKSGAIRHGGHPVLRWNAANVSIKLDPAGNIKPDKAKSTERIDGIVALVMALGVAMVAAIEKKSVYSERGIAFV